MSSSSSSSSSEDENDGEINNDFDEDQKMEPKNKKLKSGGAPLEIAPLEIAPRTSVLKTTTRHNAKVIILLDQATLETIKNRRGVYELLNCDDHRDLCRKKLHKDPNEFRPDILHQELLALTDSPLNKAGLLQVYIQTQKKVLIEVHPSCRIPRTYKRFAGLMVQLLHKLKIKATGESTTLLKVIKNPISQHLKPGTRCFGFSCEGTLYSPVSMAKTFFPASMEDVKIPTCLVVGAMATGHVTIQDHPYIEKMLSISEYPLSGAAALSRISSGIEYLWGIV